MLSLSPSSIARSSLEQMLESLNRGDENEKPKDMPPALPTRPKPTSRARLPSMKRPLPTSFVVEEAELVDNSLNCDVKKEDVRRSRRNSFGGKRVKESEPEESPYFVVAMDQKQCKQELQEEDVVKVGDARKVPRFRESEWDGNVGYFAKKKLRVWCLLRNGQWELGVIQSTSEEKAFVLLSDKSVVTVPTHELLPANPDILEGVDDLIQLSYLNEPSVLYNLQYRYSQDIIYSKAGPVLVAVNPFKDVQLYGDECITAYRQKLLHAPHVYAIADTAYNEMMTEQVSQSIIISGESGAGKTETAKIAMNYLASLGGGSNGIESNVLQTSCILEAFGNAKTARNDNSSRFGKLIEILFNASGKICSAQIQTFLLEKSRVVQLAQGERSYHIFYQLCAGAPSVIRERLRLEKACDYNYLNQSNCLEIHAVDDAQKFHALMDALDTVRICKDDQEHAFEMLAAVLWLGNISFITVGNESHVEVVADEAVTNSASLLGCSSQDLMLALSTRSIQAGKDKVAKRLKHQEAVDSRDSLAKFIYASLFDWLVEKLNVSLGTGKQHSGRSISILDIYGFESFKKNSFEQFCINYANERLQQHFNRHLFKLQQEEYEQDGIDWTKVDFTDNQDCLDLFEKKPLGLISLLDEESNFPKATSLTFATKLKQHLAANQCFKAEHGGAFSVHHYAGEVTYNTGEFLEKNRDPLYSEIVQLLFSCTNELPRLFASALVQSQKTGNPSSHLGMLARQKQSVATKFKGQLFQLMQWLESTRPHFIRCIKPNSKQIPGAFKQDLVLEQLKSCGILEVVRISRSGYPTRMPHQEFTRRYGFLLQENNACQDPLSTSVAILQQFDIQPETYQVGYTRLYFRAGQIGALEDIRKQFMQGTLEVQKFYRGHRARRYFHELKKCVVTLQSYVRGEIARKEFGILLGLNKQVISGNLDQQVMAVVQIQSVMRGWAARRYFSHLRNPSRSNARKTRPRRRISELKELPPELLPSVVEELEKRVHMAEETLGRKEKENTALRDQVVQFETRWLEYEAKMKSMEEMWQKQIKSLQVSLAAAKKSLGTENNTNQHGQFRGAQSPHSYNSENVSAGTHSPNCSGTPFRSFLSNGGADLLGGRGGTNGVSDVVSPLVREFEERKHNFDEDALAITEGKPGISASMNLVEEFRRLKRRFEAWKKDYKVRLREAKVKVQRMGASEADKHRRNWWGKKSIRF